MSIKPASYLLAGFLWCLFSMLYPGISTADAEQNPRKARILDSYGKLPLFIENRGQLDPKVRFYAKASGQTRYFTDKGIVFDLFRGEVRVLKGAKIAGEEKGLTARSEQRSRGEERGSTDDEEEPPPPPGGYPPFSCPDISSGLLENISFPSNADCQYTYRGTLTIGEGVTIKKGATVTIRADKVIIKSPFDAKEGSVVKILQ